MPAVHKSDFLLSPFHDTLMLQHFSQWNDRHRHMLTEHKANSERGPLVHDGGPMLPGDWARGEGGGGGNLMEGPKFYETGVSAIWGPISLAI